MAIDYKEYHPKRTLIRRLILKRARNRCEGSPKFPKCRVENYSIHTDTGSKVMLTIAHLDHDIANNSFENLKALCQRCHLGHDLGHHIMNRKYGKRKNQLSLYDGV